MNWNLLWRMIFGVMAGLTALVGVVDAVSNHWLFDPSKVITFFSYYWGYKYYALRFELDEEADSMDEKEAE